MMSLKSILYRVKWWGLCCCVYFTRGKKGKKKLKACKSQNHEPFLLHPVNSRSFGLWFLTFVTLGGRVSCRCPLPREYRQMKYAEVKVDPSWWVHHLRDIRIKSIGLQTFI